MVIFQGIAFDNLGVSLYHNNVKKCTSINESNR